MGPRFDYEVLLDAARLAFNEQFIADIRACGHWNDDKGHQAHDAIDFYLQSCLLRRMAPDSVKLPSLESANRKLKNTMLRLLGAEKNAVMGLKVDGFIAVMHSWLDITPDMPEERTRSAGR